MVPLDARQLLVLLQETLANQSIQYERIIEEFGQVRASEDRQGGQAFSLALHVRGLVLALLSNQRPWGPIAANLPRIEGAFFSFDPDRLIHTDPEDLVQALFALHCGNRQIRAQMYSLATNINTFRRISAEFGSIDAYVTSAEPDVIATQLSAPGSPNKLQQIGFTLAMEYLRNVGIRASKPDLHVRRAISGERLAYVSDYPTERRAYQILGQLAEQGGCNPTYLDNLLWIFCAQDYGAICGAVPRCEICLLAGTCNFPTRGHSDRALDVR